MSDQLTGDARRHLRIYLNDHLMGAAGGMELARRCLKNNPDTDLGRFLEELLADVAEDRAALEEIIALLGFRQDRLKVAAGNVGEKLGRLKFNGSLLSYSDLSRLIELEGIVAGVALKQRLWEVLREVSGVDPRLGGIDFDRLLARAASQLESLNVHRLAAARRAFGGGGVPAGGTASG